MKIDKTDLPSSVVEFKVAVDPTEFETYRAKAFASVQQSVSIDGFRKGNASEDAIVKKYGDMIILEEMANLALRDAYVKAVADYKISPISDPKVTITKLAKGNPLELTIIVPVLPEIALPSYKKIAKDAVSDNETITVTDKDIEDVIEELRKGRVHEHDHHDHAGHDHSHHDSPRHSVTAEAGHSHEPSAVSPQPSAGPKAALPELNDEFAQSFGENFKTLDDLKTKVAENLRLEKEQKLREKRRSLIMEKLIAETHTELPEAMIEQELNNMLAQMKADMTKFGGTWEDYLKHSKKTEDEIKTSWRGDAVKRSMSQLILHKIAEAEKLYATDEEIEVELVRLLATVQDADEERAKAYLHQALSNEKVLKFLEESK